MTDKQNVLILNGNGGIVFQDKAKLTNIEKDHESDCLIADCHINNEVILVWKIDNLWQGWKH